MVLCKMSQPRLPVRFRGDFENLFDHFFGGELEFPDATKAALANWAPAMDVSETEKNFTIRAELPGMEAKDVEITLSDRTLTIAGEKSESSECKDGNACHCERRFGAFQRTVELPETANVESLSADYKNGVLTVKIDKREEVLPKRITVQAG